MGTAWMDGWTMAVELVRRRNSNHRDRDSIPYPLIICFPDQWLINCPSMIGSRRQRSSCYTLKVNFNNFFFYSFSSYLFYDHGTKRSHDKWILVFYAPLQGAFFMHIGWLSAFNVALPLGFPQHCVEGNLGD